MASMMHKRSGLVGPRGEHVETPFVFKGFLKGQGRPEESKKSFQASEPARWEGGSVGKADNKCKKIINENEHIDMR